MQTRKMFRRAYLHIGLGKTGTSAIQTQLYKHARQLECEHDIHYPCALDAPSKFIGNHSRYLSAMFVDASALQREHILAGFRSLDHVARHAEKVRAKFEEGFAASKASRLLISAEGTGHFAKPRLCRLSEWLQQFAEEIEIIACVRHPVDALSSEIQQRLKLGHVLEDLYATPPYYKLRGLFGRIAQAFPGSKTVVYPFSAAVEDPRGLTGVLLQQIGIDVDWPVAAAQPDNASMSHEAALLLSAVNRARPMLVNNGRNVSRSPRMTIDFMRIPGRKFQAPREVCDRVELMAAAELRWLRDTHGVELRAAPIVDELDYHCFSGESIGAISLRLGELSKLQYARSAPLRFFAGNLRVILNNMLRKLSA